MSITDWLPPPFAWCAIPPGAVTLAGGPDTFQVGAFDLAQYPITHAQFQVFVEAPDGYADINWWDFSAKARRWREQYGVAESDFPGGDLPRSTVSWFEAVAFCRWLSAIIGESVSLPTEQDWQRAAQDDDGRLYPWGDTFSTDLCNISESGYKEPTPVTRYPLGASPYGVMDMSGNIAEWCVNAFNVPDDADIHTFAGGEARSVRGGSWGVNQGNARATFRSFNYPGDRFNYLGFRIARHR